MPAASSSCSGPRIISLCAAPLGIIGKQFSFGSTAMSAITARSAHQHLADHVIQLLDTFGTQADGVEAVRELHEVRQCRTVAFRIATAVQQFLPLTHHSHVLVVQDEHLHRQPVLRQRAHLLDVHQHGCLAGDVDHQRLGMCHLHAHRRRQAVAHRAETTTGHPMVRLLEVEMLRGPHLMLADLGGDEDLLANRPRQFIEPLDSVLRLDDRAGRHVLAEFQAVLRAPRIDLAPPGRDRLRIGHRCVRLPRRDQRVQHAARIADDRHVNRHVLVDRRTVDVGMDLLRPLAERVQPSGHPVIKPRADVQQHVAAMHGQVGLVGAVHPQHAEELRIGGGIGAETHQRVGDREAGHADELCQCRPCCRAGVDHAAAGIDHRPLGRLEQCDSLVDLTEVRLGARAVARVALGRRRVRCRPDHDVLRQVDHHRTRPAGAGDVECLVHHARQVLGALYQVVVLGGRASDAGGVGLLEGVVADQVGGHLAGQANHRDGIHQRIHQTGDRVGGARTGGHQHDADLAGGAGVALGRMHRTALLADQDVADGILLEQRVVDRQYGAAGIPEDDLHALVLQGAEENFCSRLGFVCRHGRAPGDSGGAPISWMVRCVNPCFQ